MASWPNWRNNFDERQNKQIDFARIYASDAFRHGAPGHNDMLIIAKMADVLDLEDKVAEERAARIRPITSEEVVAAVGTDYETLHKRHEEQRARVEKALGNG